MANICFNPATITVNIANLKSAKEIPSYCRGLAKILADQPQFNGYGSFVERCHVIRLESKDEARICDIFSKNSLKTLGYSSSWHIHEFGYGSFRLQDSKHRCLNHGLTLWLHNAFKMCSLDELEDSYNQVFESMASDWACSELVDNPELMFKENSNEFALFTKENSLMEECTLIRLIADKFSSNSDVKCHADWLYPSPYCYSGKLYLWVKKSALADVIDKFGFKF